MSLQKFNDTAPKYMRLLMQDFGFDLLDAAAVFGNAGHESGGLSNLQEDKPTVPGSRGGWGWFQWTGPRRREMERYAARNNLNLRDDQTNYNWLFVELKGSEKRAVSATKNATGLRNKVIAFEKTFERAGVKHYDSRVKWAERALAAYDAEYGEEIPSEVGPDGLDNFQDDELVAELLTRENVKSVLVEYG